MKKYSAIYCLAIICQLLMGFNGNSQSKNIGIEILQHPVFEPVCAGEGATLSVQASGSGLSYQWQVFKKEGNYEDVKDTPGISGSQTAQLHIASLSKSMNQYLYRCKISQGAEEQFTLPAVVELKNAIINIDPVKGTGYVGDYHSLEVYATGAGLTFQWQVDQGSGFTNIEDDGTYKGSKTRVLSIPEVVKKMEDYQYRCIVSGHSCEEVTLTSKPAGMKVGTGQNPLKAEMGGMPNNVIWYMNGMAQAVTFFGNPVIHVDGAVQVVNNSRILSQNGTGASCEINITGHLKNDNTSSSLLTPGDISQFIFAGADAQEIQGGDATRNNFYKIRINKTGNNLTLNSDISFRNNLEFMNGDLGLNGKNAYLTFVNNSFIPQILADTNYTKFPTIINETENNRILGPTGAVLISNQQIANSNPFTTGFNPGNIGAEIRDPNLNLASKYITIERQHTTSASGGTNSIQRLYKISSSPDTPVPANMDFTFRYLDGDHNLNATNENTLKLFKSDNSGTSWAAQTTDELDISNNFAKQNSVPDITTWWRLFPCLNAPVPTFTEGAAKHLCNGTAYTITPNITGTPAAYSWLLNGTEVDTTATYSVTGVAGTPNQTLVLKVFNAAGCFNSATLTLIHEPAINIEMGPNVTLCLYTNHTWNVTSPGVTNYTWKLNGTTVQNGSSGMYTFMANSPGGPYNLKVTASTAYCAVSDSITLTVDGLLVSLNGGLLIEACEPGSVTLDATPYSPGIPPYDYNWHNGASNALETFSYNSNATYSVTVTDAFGCTTSDMVSVLYSNLVLTQTHTNINCFGQSTGAIDLTVTGSYGSNLNYVWSNGTTTEDLTGLPAGTYTVTVTETVFFETCTRTMSVTLTQPTAALALSASITDVLCNGGNNGLIDLTVNGGTAPFTYNWGVGQPTTQDRSGLSAGTYHVTVTDANLCTITGSFTVAQPDVLTASTFPAPAVVHVNCNGNANGAISWTIVGGTGPYDFSWTRLGGGYTSTDEDLTGLSGGTYNVTVTDAHSCTYTASFVVNEPAALATIVTPENVWCFGTSTGSVITSTSGGTLPYSYFWTDTGGGFISDAQSIFNLVSGTYNLTITDGHGCTLTPPAITISEPPSALSVVATVSQITCFGANNAFINLATSGGWGGYLYLWSGPNFNSTAQNINSLAPGYYQLTVTDANNCVFLNDFIITEPTEISLNENVSNITCHDYNDGSITLNVSGGTGTYTYNWQWAGGSSTASSISNLSGGTYALTVTDANLCTKTGLFTITNPAVISATDNVLNVSCFGYQNGGIYLTPSGGTLSGGDYFYTWTGPDGFTANSQNIDFLVPGMFSVSVTDFYSCPSFVGTYIITEPTQLLANPIITMPLECFGDTDGQMNANPSGGTPPYNFSWTGPNGFTASTQFISNLSLTGTYTIYITDANGCHSPGEGTNIELTGPPEIITSAIVTDVGINGGSDGAIDLTASGGTGTLSYLWSNGAVTPDIAGLMAGTYTVSITDDNDCVKSASFIVEEPAVLNIAVEVLANVSCNGGNDGFIVTYATGGVGPFTFSWSNGETTFQINDLVPGSYTLTLTDANGAVDVETFTITQPDPILPNTVQVNVSCFGAMDGSITLSPTGGTPPYLIIWDGDAGPNPLTNLGPGTHSLTIRDDNFCDFSASYTITEPPQLATGSTATDATCFGYNDGSIELTASGGTLPYSYNWENGVETGSGSGTNIPALYASSYSITLTDEHDCTATTFAFINQPPSLNVTITGNSYLCASESSVLDAGPGFTGYVWSTGATTQTITISTGAVYSVTVTGTGGCTESADIPVFVYPLPTLILNSTICAPDLLTFDVEITSSVSDVMADFGMVTDNGDGTYTISGVPDGQDVTITVSGGDPPCQNVLVVTAPDCNCPTVNPPVSGGNQTLCLGETILPLTVTVGTDETADWYDAPTGGSLLHLGNTSYTLAAPGTFYAEARNTINGCVSSTRTVLTLTINPLPTANAGADVSICAGANTQLDASGSSGSGTLTYLWNPATGLSNPNIANPVASPTATTTYTVLVTDANTCSATDEVTVTVNPLPIAGAGADVAICAGANTQLDANGSSGSGTLGFQWSPSAGLSNPNIANPVANPLGTTTYTVMVTDGNGCFASDAVTITVNPLPTLTLNSAICDPDLMSYEVLVTSNAGQLTADFGTVTDNGNGTFSITGVPVGQNLTLTATFTATGCQKTLMVTAPNCTCPVVNPPVSNGNQAICFGDPIQALTVTVGMDETADWYDAPAGGNLLLSGNTSFTPTAAGTFYAEARNTVNNCVSSSRTALALIINPLPTAVAGADVAICTGTGTQLDASGSSGSGTLVYLWSPTVGLNDPNIANPVANPAATTTYTVQVTDANACSASDDVIVTVNPVPTAIAGADVAICAGSNSQLNAGNSTGNGTLSYQWSPSAGLNNPNIANPVANPLGTTTYTVTVTNGNGCTDTDAVTVTINPLPTLTLNSATCAADLLSYNVLVTSNANQLSADYGTVTNNNNGTFSINGIPPNQNVALTATVSATGCQKTLLVIAPDCSCPVINPPISNGNQTICAGTPIPALTVTVGANQTADWYSAAAGGTLLLSGNTGYTPTAAGTYYTEARNTINNCVSATRTAVTLTINPLPTANAGADVAICTGSSTTLNAGGSSGSGTLTYQWSPAAGLSNPNIVNPVASPAATTTYTVLVTDGNACSASDGVVVTVNPLPVLTIDTATCAPNLLTYTVTGFSNADSLTATAGTMSTMPGGSFILSGVPAGQNVTLTASFTATGCQVSQSVLAPDCSCPIVAAPVSGGNQAICSSSPIPALTVTVNANETADWYDAATGGNLLQQGNTSYTPAGAGTYYAEARNTINNCISGTRTAVVLTINSLPVANAGLNVAICSGSSTTLNASGSSGSGTLAYLWTPAAGLNNPNIVNPLASPAATTTYTVKVTDGNGCTATDQVAVTVNPLPTLMVADTVCTPDLLTYSVLLTSNGNVTATLGTVNNNGGNSYTVSGVPTGQDVTVTATFPATGCQTMLTVLSPLCPCPTVNAPVSGGNHTICSDSPIPTLTVTVDANETADWYSAPTGGSLLLSGNTSYTPGTGGTFYAEARNTINNCLSSTRTAVVLTINPVPVANAGPDVAFCTGGYALLYGAGSTGSGLSYLWSPPTNLVNPYIANPVAFPLVNTTYTLQVTDNKGCTDTDPVIVTVNPLPDITIISSTCAPDLLSYQVEMTTTGDDVSSNHGTVVNNGGGSFTITDIPVGQNIIITVIQTATGCQKTQSVNAPNCSCPAVNAPVSSGNVDICIGTTIPALTVTVGAGLVADWYDAPSGGNLLLAGNTSYTPTGAGTFYAEARDPVNGCTSNTRTAVVLTINPLPVANAGADVAICAGTGTTLNAGGSTGSGTLTYLWTPSTGLSNPNIVNPVANPADTTTYTVLVTDDNGCSASDQVIVSVKNLPSASAGADVAICFGQSTMLDANGSTGNGTLVYLWSPATGLNNPNIATPVASPASSTTYTVKVTDNNGCTATDGVLVTIHNLPIANAGTDAEICIGSSTVLNAGGSSGNGTLSYLWSPPTALSAINIPNPTANPVNTIIYNVQVTDGNGCTASDQVQVTVNSLPVANAGADVAICTGSSTQLNANGSSGSGTLAYLWSPTTGLNNPNIVNPVASPTATTTYTVTVTDGNGCSSNDPVIVTVNPLPTLVVNSATCAPNLLSYTVSITTSGDNLTASAGTVVNNGGGSFTVSGIPPAQNVTVTAIFTATSCQVSQLVMAPDCSCPVVAPPVSGGNQQVCLGSPLPTLTVTVNANETADWYNAPSGGILLQQNSTSYTPAGPGIYYAQARNTVNNCISSTRTGVVLTINPLPFVLAGPDVAICLGSGTTLNAVGGGGVVSYLWTPATGLNNPNIANPVASPTATTNYTVLVTNGNDCTATDQVTVTVNPLPTLTIGATVCAPNLLTYSVSVNSNGNVTATPGTVIINGGGSFTVIGVPTGQNVTVTAMLPSTGCQIVQTVDSPLCPCPVVNAPVSGGNQTICASSPIPALTVTVGANQTADWYDAATGGNLLLSGNTSYTPTGAGTYYAEARNTINNCVSSTRTAVVLTINPMPVANAGADVALCFGTNTILNAGGSTGVPPLSFSWTPTTGLSNPNIANPVANPSATTTYTVVITNGNGCTASDNVLVTVNNLPIANAGADVAICIGSSTVLNAGNSTGNGTLAYAWIPGTGLSATNIVNPVASPTTSTTYTVQVTDGNGCSATDQVLVTLNPLPVITVNNVLCESNLLEYHVLITTNANMVTSSAGTVFDIGSGQFLINNVPNGQNITITATQSATGCQVQQGVNAPDCNCPPVNPPISGGDQAICAGQPIPALTITVGPGETAAWYDAPTSGILIISGVTSFTPNGAGTFYVEAVNTNSNCTSATRTPVTLSINPLPVANAGADATTCSGIGVQLDASGSMGSGGLAFVWSPATGLSNPNIVNPVASPAITTTYTVLATDGIGCSSSDQVVVSVGSVPTLAVNVPACSPDLLTYEVGITTNGDNLTASLGTVTNNGGGAYSIIGIPAGQDLLLTITNTANSCLLSHLVPAPDCDCPFMETPLSNGNEEICEGETIHILSVQVNPGETADWYDAPTGGNLLLAGSTEYLPSGAGTFYAEARHIANNCTSGSRVALFLIIHPLPVSIFDDPTDLCAGSLPIGLAATPVGGTFSGTGVSGNQFDASVAGIGVFDLTYSFTDGNGCTAEIQQNIEVFALPSVLAGSNSPVCDGDDLLLTESNANTIAWEWSGPNGFLSTEQNPVIPAPGTASTGVYEVVVTSSSGCTNSASIAVSLNPALGLSLDPQPAAFCPGGNVQLAALPTGGNGIFDYVWTTPSGGSESGQAVLADEAGTWSVVVTDGSGCTISGSATVAELPALAISFTSTNASCNSSDGTLTATVSGGLAPYGYEWDGLPNTTNMLAGVPAGGYQLIVTDANGCVFSDTGFVANTNAPAVALNSIVNVLCSGAATGSISINVTGGSMPYSFNWTNGDMTQNIIGLTAGQYGLEVTDALGCIVNNVFQVTEPPALAGVLATTQTTTPFTGDGAIDLTVSGGTPPYQFAWSIGLNSEDISNLFIGPYSVTITDANGCSVVESTVVTAVGALAVNVVGQNISCNGLGDGGAEAIISGGLMPYTILWSTGSNLTVIDNLLPGNYQVTVTDQNGGTSTGSVTLTQPPLLQAFTQTTDNVCNGASAGAANVFPSGGTMPYAYGWSNGEMTQAILGIVAGVYTVTITDANGCTNEQSATVDEPPAMQIAIDAVTDNVCFGNMEGAIDISVSGGAFPYFANWSSGASTQDISDLSAGIYMVTITDFQACTATASITVGEAPEMLIDFTNAGVVCFGEANGSLVANVSGGTPGAMGYQFNWTNGGITATIDNLVSGNYFVTVTDELGCTAVSNDFVAQPALLLGNLTVENITCFGLANGSAVVQPTGGTMPYTYLWATNEVDSLLEDLDIGDYSVVITDANGCSTIEALQITQPDVLAATATVADLNCFNDFSGAIDLTVSGGTPSPFGGYVITWSSGQFTEDIDQLSAGEFVVTISDDNNCTIFDTITVAQPDAIFAEAEINHVQCFGENNGAIILSVSGGNFPYLFNWENGINTPEITGLSVGNYANTITDNNGCIVYNSFEITQPDILSMDYQIQRAGCSASDDGGIDITVEGGVPGYIFSWSHGAVTEDASQLTAGTYTVTATDGNGCSVSQSLTVANTPGTFEAYFLAASGLFDVDSVEVNSDDIIQFVDVSFPSPVSWQWFFGDPDSSTSELPNPAFSYPNDETVQQSSYMATLIASNLFCTDTMTKQIWITNNMRLNAPQEDSLAYLTFTNLLAYPNPTTGTVTLDIQLSREETVRLYVVDVLGKILEQNELDGEDHYVEKLDFTGWTPGVYFINLRSVNQVHTVKIVVAE